MLLHRIAALKTAATSPTRDFIAVVHLALVTRRPEARRAWWPLPCLALLLVLRILPATQRAAAALVTPQSPSILLQ